MYNVCEALDCTYKQSPRTLPAHALQQSTDPIPSVAPPTDHTHQSATHILEASLPFVPELGWSVAAISEGAKSLGLVGGDEKFPRGGGELVDYFEQQCNQKLVAFMEEQTQCVP